MRQRGFTLLEVLIAMVVLAISLAGIYTLLRSNIDTTGYTLRKIELLEAGSEVFYTLYKEQDVEPTPGFVDLKGYEGIKYEVTESSLGLSYIREYTLRLKKNEAEIVYNFYR
ncbi:MAG: prepilin-type N-terminal cleavage/methylation domain-containing protein [Nitrospirae bacterium]|nr:prepilin-type N-terminal cleavage/methylation domain-containing protein [Nitrospirota bacterium]